MLFPRATAAVAVAVSHPVGGNLSCKVSRRPAGLLRTSFLLLVGSPPPCRCAVGGPYPDPLTAPLGVFGFMYCDVDPTSSATVPAAVESRFVAGGRLPR